MTKHRSGIFEVEVCGPYPMWISVSDDREGEIRLRHEDLRDLKHAIDVAIRDASNRLGEKYAAEI